MKTPKGSPPSIILKINNIGNPGSSKNNAIRATNIPKSRKERSTRGNKKTKENQIIKPVNGSNRLIPNKITVNGIDTTNKINVTAQ